MTTEPRGPRGEPSAEEAEARAHDDVRRAEMESHAGEASPARRLSSVLDNAWLFVAVLLLASALFLLLRSHTDGAFVAAALGVCAWFLNIREGLKRKYKLQRHGHRNWKPRDDAEE